MAGRVRLRELGRGQSEKGGLSGASGPGTEVDGGGQSQQAVPLRPLNVAGVVVRKDDLIEALRVYVPGLVDLQVTDDGEFFWLMLSGDGPDGPGGGTPGQNGIAG